MLANLPTYLPVDEAAEQYGISINTLNTALEQGTLKAIQLSDGDLLVAVGDVQVLSEQLKPAPVDSELAGQPIRVTAAAEKYHLDSTNLCRWAYAGYIRILERGPKLLVLDEGDVQRAASLFHRAHQETGSPLRAGWVLKRALGTS